MKIVYYSKSQPTVSKFEEKFELNNSYVGGDLDNLDNIFLKILMCCLVALDDL